MVRFPSAGTDTNQYSGMARYEERDGMGVEKMCRGGQVCEMKERGPCHERTSALPHKSRAHRFVAVTETTRYFRTEITSSSLQLPVPFLSCLPVGTNCWVSFFVVGGSLVGAVGRYLELFHSPQSRVTDGRTDYKFAHLFKFLLLFTGVQFLRFRCWL